MDVRDLRGKTALVTGSASGIGRATALELARRGADLFLCDVSEDGLLETQRAIEALGRKAHARRVDVAEVEQMRAFAEFVHGHVDAVDVLVNNAGVGLGAGLLDTTLEDWNWIVGINLMGVVHGLHFFASRMVARGRGGHVVNVSSAAGFVASEPLAAYSATKFAVLGLSQAIASELGRHQIGVTAACPGIINTPITTASRMRGPGATPEARQRMVELYRRRNYGPERVAKNLLRAIQRNRLVAPISPEAWALYWLVRLAPWAVRWLNRAASARLAREAAAAAVDSPR